MSTEQVHERANSTKVQERIIQDGYDATKRALEGVKDDLVKRGFDAREVIPFISEGASEAALDFED